MRSPILAGCRFRVGLIGCGRISASHFGAIEKHVKDIELVAVCDTDAGRLAEHQARYKVSGYADVGEMLEKVGLGSQLGALRKRAEKLDAKGEDLSCDAARKEFLKYEGNRLKRAFQQIADHAGVRDSR